VPGRKSSKREEPSQATATGTVRELPAAEIMSFLQEIGTSTTWTETDLAKSLKIESPRAKEVLSVLQLQGYIEPAGTSGKWRTTDAGALVSGTKPARYTRESVEAALISLIDRIRAVNDDRGAGFTIDEAVAFGDILSDKPRVQSANVGVRLTPREDEPETVAAKHIAGFLKELRGKSALLHLQLYEPWMSARSHRKLI
jgi:hypothetical protein